MFLKNAGSISFNFDLHTNELKKTNNKNLKFNENNINPWWITGFTVGDGSFYCSMSNIKNAAGKIYWTITLGFELVAVLNTANKLKLEKILDYFTKLGCSGSIRIKNNCYILSFRSIKNALILKDHFLKYPLLSYKLVFFKLWIQILDLLLKKEHLTKAGLLKVIALKSQFKKGLSKDLKFHFYDFTPLEKPKYLPSLSLLNIFWIAGFYNADSSFYIYTTLNSKNKLGVKFYYGIDLIQDQISYEVLKAILDFFGFGNIYNKGKTTAYIYRCSTLSNITHFIKIFDEAQLLGSKALDYRDFKIGIEIFNKKEHLTLEGLSRIKHIIKNINSNRTNFK